MTAASCVVHCVSDNNEAGSRVSGTQKYIMNLNKLDVWLLLVDCAYYLCQTLQVRWSDIWKILIEYSNDIKDLFEHSNPESFNFFHTRTQYDEINSRKTYDELLCVGPTGNSCLLELFARQKLVSNSECE